MADVKAQVTNSINKAASDAAKSVAAHAKSAGATVDTLSEKATAAVQHVQNAALNAVDTVNNSRVVAKHFFNTTTGKIVLGVVAAVLIAAGVAIGYFG